MIYLYKFYLIDLTYPLSFQTACDPPVKVVNTPPSGAEDQPMTEVANQVQQVTPQEATVTEEGGKVEEIVIAGAANQCPDQPTALIVA